MTGTWFVWVGIWAVFTAVVVLFMRHQRRRRGERELGCGRCGYPVRGLPTSICPECGSDTAVVGVRRSAYWYALRPRTRTAVACLAWTVWLLAGAYLAWPPYMEYLQPLRRIEMDAVMFVNAAGEYGVFGSRVWEQTVNGCANANRPKAGPRLGGWSIELRPHEPGGFGVSSDMYGPSAEQPIDRHPHSVTNAGYFLYNLATGQWLACEPIHEAGCWISHREGPAPKPPCTCSTSHLEATPPPELLNMRSGRSDWRQELLAHLRHSGKIHDAETEIVNITDLTGGFLAFPFRQKPRLAPPWSSLGSGSASGGWRPAPGYTPAILLGLGLVWLAGALASWRSTKGALHANPRPSPEGDGAQSAGE